MNVFTLNSGSSSIKFRIVDTDTGHKALHSTLSQRSLIGVDPLRGKRRNEHEG